MSSPYWPTSGQNDQGLYSSYQSSYNGTDAFVIGNQFIGKNEEQINGDLSVKTKDESKEAERRARRKIQNRYACQR